MLKQLLLIKSRNIIVQIIHIEAVMTETLELIKIAV